MSDLNKYTSLQLDGEIFQKEELINLSTSILNSDKSGWEKDIYSFILEWLNENDFITVFTSGSTGKPKQIKLQKSALIFSAKNTINFLKLNKGDSTLLCIPAKYIGGKMMVVRAFVGEMNLSYSKPNSIPFSNLKTRINFSAITPLQASKSNPEELQKIDKLIIGGGNINKILSKYLEDINSIIYSTYGMTETASHIALKNISKKSEYFEVLDGISIDQDERNCLVIDAPNLSSNKIITNDLVELVSDSKFIWKGRFDNVINSGGIKLYPEEIENKLSQYILERFFITKMEDKLLGEKLVLIIESDSKIDLKNAFKKLDKYEVPKEVFYTSTFVETENGKIQRDKTMEQIKRGL